jgi:translocation and assembly module TamB
MSQPDEPEITRPAMVPPEEPPPRRRRRALAWGGLALIVLLLLAAVFVTWLVTSRAGARFVFARVSSLVPGVLRAEQIEGPVRGPLVLRNLHYETERFVVDVAEVRLAWHPWRLRRRAIDVDELFARGVRVRILPSEVVAERKLNDVDFRYNVVIRALRVDDVRIERPTGGRPLIVHRLTMKTGEWRDRLLIEDVDVVSPDVDLDARGWLRPKGDYPLDVQMAWSYRPPEKQAPLQGRGRLSGTLRALRLDQRLEKPFPATIRGTLAEALFDPRFTGEADFTGLQPRLYAPTSPVTRASGHVTFTNATLAEFQATARGRIDVEDWGTMDVDGRLARDGDTWHFDALTVKRPDAPGHLTWVGDFVVAADEPARFGGRAEWVQMAWPLDVHDPAVRSARGTARAEGTFDDYRLVVDGTFAFPNVPAGRWQGTARGNRTQLVAETVEGRILGGRVAGRGRVTWKPAIAWSLDATAYGIDPHATYSVVPAALSGGSWRIVGHGDERAMVVESLRVDNPHGALIASGGFAWEPTFTWHADATTRGISPAALFPEVPAELAGGDWHFVGRGTDARAELSRVEGAFLGGMVDAAGTVAWEPSVSWSLAGNVRNVDPSRAYEGWNGNLSGAFRTAGKTVGDEAAGEVVFEDVTGTLRDRELSAHGTVVLGDGTVSLAGVEGSWGPARLALTGEISPQLGLGFDVRELDLASLDPRAAGVVTARGTVRGEPTAPVVDATLAGTGVGWTTHRAATLEGRFALDLAPGGTIDVDLTASDLHIGAEKLDAMSLQAKGTREAHTLTVTTRGAEGSFELAASGGFPSAVGARAPTTAAAASQLVWTGTLTRLAAETPETGRWELASPTPVTIGASQARVQGMCWVSADAGTGTTSGARLCADLDWRGAGSASGEALQVDATATELPLRLFARLLPPDLVVAGSVSGDVHLRTAAGGVLVGEAVLRPSGAALWSATRGEEVKLQLEGGEVRLTADAGGVAIRGNVRLANNEKTQGSQPGSIGTIQGSVTLPGYRFGRPPGEQPLIGHVTAQLGDLRFLQAVVPMLGATTGQATADLALSGTLAAPGVGGNVHLTGGAAEVPSLGLKLTDIEITASGDGSGPLTITGSLRSGESTLRITGTSPLLPGKGQPLRLDLTGERVQVANLDEARIVANPDLQLAYDGALLQVAGRVVVPQAQVTYKRGKVDAVEPSRDVVFVGTQVPQAVDVGIAIAARIRIVLRDDVKLSAEGLETKLRGSLLVVEDPVQGTTASGQLELSEGTFKAYGQDLVIERGRLYYVGGPLLDPGIDVRAYRKVIEDNVTAGINARGTLRAPEVTVWADPTMSDSEALSYLLLGRPLESTNEQEGSMLANAATSLGIRGGNLLAKKLGAALGLQEASIVAGDTLQEAAFVIGKYLSPRLYLSYGIGLFDASSTLRIRYLVSERLHLEAQTGARTSGDVLYTLEHGPPSRREMAERYRQRDLPRIKPEELSTPPKVPVGAEGEEQPTGASTTAAGAAEASGQAQRAVRQTEEEKKPPPLPAPTPHP